MSQTRMMAKRLILWAEDRGESLSREGTDLLRSTDKKDKRKRGYSYMPVKEVGSFATQRLTRHVWRNH